MAIVPCPECNENISNEAISCPKCGYPFLLKKNQAAFDIYFKVIYYRLLECYIEVDDAIKFLKNNYPNLENLEINYNLSLIDVYTNIVERYNKFISKKIEEENKLRPFILKAKILTVEKLLDGSNDLEFFPEGGVKLLEEIYVFLESLKDLSDNLIEFYEFYFSLSFIEFESEKTTQLDEKQNDLMKKIDKIFKIMEFINREITPRYTLLSENTKLYFDNAIKS